MKTYRILFLICLGALALRLLVLQFVQHPGTADPNHYYNLGLRLVEGHGLTIDYIWQFNDPPDQLEHPDDYWMPVTGIVTAASMKLFGTDVRGAVGLNIIIGSLIPMLAYAAARQFGLVSVPSLLAAAFTAVLPEFVLNSVRTDTTVPNVPLFVGSCLLFIHGLRTGRALAFAGSGLLAGLSYLTRSEGALLIPAFMLILLIHARWGRPYSAPGYWRYAVLIPVLALIVTLPWFLRNLQVNGTLTTPKIEYMFFLTDYREHFVYDTELSLQTLLASQTPQQLIGKRLFEMAASLKIMYTTLDIFLPIALTGGLLLLLWGRDRGRWLALSPALLLLAGFFIFYTVLVPFKSQGGSFKKAYLTLIPLLVPVAAYAIERVATGRSLQIGTVAIAIAFMSANAVELVRADARAVNTYLSTAQQLSEIAHTLPDRNGDGQIVLMTQDPFMLRFVGIRSVMYPMEDRETVIEVANRYWVDYLLMPAARPSLDPIFFDTEQDARFTFVQRVPATNMQFYSLNVDSG